MLAPAENMLKQFVVPTMPVMAPAPNTTIEHKKEMARQLLDALDPAALATLAQRLQTRGLLQQYAGVTQPPPGSWNPAGAGAGVASPPLAAPAMPPAAPPGGWYASMAASQDAAMSYASPPQVVTLEQQLQATPYASPPVAAAPAPYSGHQYEHSVAAGPVAEQVVAPKPVGIVQPAPVVEEALAVAGEDEKAEKPTTLIVRNLPSFFNQDSLQAWLDKNAGYEGTYDFLLWFPAKNSARLNSSSYAFVNFMDPANAGTFRKDFHQARLHFDGQNADPDAPLSIAAAKVQGFAENYIRYGHISLDSGSTKCKPYFDQDTLNKLPKEVVSGAAQAASAMAVAETTPQGAAQTLVIRNLPSSLETQESARKWFDKQGCEGKYDFFLFMPPKPSKRRVALATVEGLAYAFVNFRTLDNATECMKNLNGHHCDGDTESLPLNVVASRVQGFEELQKTYNKGLHRDRLAPWVDEAKSKAQPALRQFQ